MRHIVQTEAKFLAISGIKAILLTWLTTSSTSSERFSFTPSQFLTTKLSSDSAPQLLRELLIKDPTLV